MKNFGRVVVMVAALAVASSLPARAVNKDMVQLQTQMQQLQDAIARLQRSNDESMGVMKDLMQQTADSVNKMTLTVNALQQQMAQANESSTAKNEAFTGQIQSVNDSLDELRARLERMEKVLGNVQGQQAQTNAILSSGGGASVPASAPAAAAPDATPAPVVRGGDGTQGPASGEPLPMPSAATGGNAAPAAAGPSATDMYHTAYGDYMAGKKSLATSEFSDLIKAYPDDNLSGNASFYLGELDLRGNKPSAAIKDYDHTVEHYPNNVKVPAARLHKAEALAQTGQRDAAAREYRALIARYPTSPEAAQAKARLVKLR
jgi:TolA-binding protein